MIKKIKWVKNLCSDKGDIILNDPVVKRLINILKEKIDNRKRYMTMSGMIDICRKCEEEDGGSCCGKGIEDRYDEFMLIINKLLGCELPEKRYKPDSCFFLRNNGCILAAPHVLCINYVCKKIEDNVSKNQIIRLRYIEGEMITIIFKLREYLMKLITSHVYGINKKDLI